MRAELLETPWTWIVMPVEPELARPDDSCALLRISRTLVPVSTFSPPHTAFVDHATARGSPPGTLTALTIARHRPGGPSMCPTTGEPLCPDPWTTPLGSVTDSGMKLPGSQIATLALPPPGGRWDAVV